MNTPLVMATLTLDRCNREFVEKMMACGMSAVRINSAHVTPPQLKEMVTKLKSISSELIILTDTKGAEVRTSFSASAIEIKKGQRLRFAYGPDKESSSECVWLNADEIERYISVGQRVLVDDGEVELKVTDIAEGQFIAVALHDGKIESRKTVGFPGVDLMHLPSVTSRDREAIIAARAAGVDMIAHSFVRNAADIKAVRALLSDSSVKIYAKIECKSALQNLDEIMDASDGILFARGDLGVAIPLSQLPVVQYKVLSHCREKGCKVILSTQLLQSMVDHPLPTRAEVNDIFLGVAEGASIFLLCGETAQGNYPFEAVRILQQTLLETTSFFCAK